MLPVITVTRPTILTGQTNGRLPDSLLSPTPGQAGGPEVRLVEPAARAWRAMAAAALADGHTLKATSRYDSYRPYPVQYTTFLARYEPDPLPGFIGSRYWPDHRDLQGNFVAGRTWYQKPNTAVAAVPGTSNHGLGLAVDVAGTGSEQSPAPLLRWLLAHAATFGWSWETQSESWHIRYCTGDAIPQAVRDYEERMSDMDLQCLVRYTDDPKPRRVWLCNRMLRREVAEEELVDVGTSPAYLDAVIAGTQPANGPVADIGAYVGGPLANNSRVFQTSGFTAPRRDTWGVDVAGFGGTTGGLTFDEAKQAAFEGAQRAEDE